MASKEPGKKQPKKPPTPGLMTRGRLQMLQNQELPKKQISNSNNQEIYENKTKSPIIKEENDKFRPIMGNWYPQGIWQQNQMIRMTEGQKIIPKQPGYFIPPIHPQLAQQMAQGISPIPHQIQGIGIQPGQIPPMIPIHPGHIQQKHGIPPLNPKLPPMPQLIMPGMRGIPYSPKSSQTLSPISSKGIRNIPNMQNISRLNNIMRRNIYKSINPDSPTYIKQQVIRNRYSKISNSPKSMEAFLNETLYKEEKIDLNQLLREEITKILEEELDRINDLHTDKNNYLSISSKLDNNEDKIYNYKDLPEIVEILIENFKPILEILWKETKNYHQYSLDEYYYILNPNIDNSNQLINQQININNNNNKEKENNNNNNKNKNIKNNYELVIIRNFEGLRTLFQKRDEIDKLMTSYRNISRSTLGRNIFTFSNFNTNISYEEQDNQNNNQDKKLDPYLKKAIEYADVALNQKLLLNNVTALDFKAALSGDYLCNYLPNTFRNKLIETVNAIHFDLGTPPQLSPKLNRKLPEQKDVLSKVCETLENLQNVDIQNNKLNQNRQNHITYMKNYNPYARDERLIELINKQGGINNNFNITQGVNIFPNIDTNTTTIQQQMTNITNLQMNIPNIGKPITFTQGNQQNFNIPPGSIPNQIQGIGLQPGQIPPMIPIQPHMPNNNNNNNNNQFLNK